MVFSNVALAIEMEFMDSCWLFVLILEWADFQNESISSNIRSAKDPALIWNWLQTKKKKKKMLCLKSESSDPLQDQLQA